MASLKLSNADQSNQAVRPSFKERAAALKALAARVVRTEPATPPELKAEPIDWHSPPPGFMAHPAIEPQAFINIPEGLRLELRRLCNIADGEFERRAEAGSQGVVHEAMRTGFENRLRRQLRLDEIRTALAPERPVSAGIEAEGTIFYEDAAGNTRRAPVAQWINFTAMRMYGVAHQELSRQFNAGCTANEIENRELDAKLRRELRTDALFALAFRSHKVFEAAPIERYGTEEEIAAAKAEASPDPIFVAMQTAHYAKLEHDRFEERVKGTVSNPADREEEWRLMDADSCALQAVFETTPTTRAGQLSLHHWIREQISNAGCLDGEPADGHESWADGYRALEAALLAPPADRGNLARRQADEIDLSGCSIRVLARLCEKFTAAAGMWSDMSCLPFVKADEAATRIVDEEYARAGHVRDRIIGLLRNHRPKDDDERDEILGARLRYEMDCEGVIRDAVLLADLTAAWRA